MRKILGHHHFILNTIINGHPDNSKLFGFSKCSTTGEYIFKDGAVRLCDKPECKSCIEFEERLKKFRGTAATEHK